MISQKWTGIFAIVAVLIAIGVLIYEIVIHSKSRPITSKIIPGPAPSGTTDPKKTFPGKGSKVVFDGNVSFLKDSPPIVTFVKDNYFQARIRPLGFKPVDGKMNFKVDIDETLIPQSETFASNVFSLTEVASGDLVCGTEYIKIGAKYYTKYHVGHYDVIGTKSEVSLTFVALTGCSISPTTFYGMDEYPAIY